VNRARLQLAGARLVAVLLILLLASPAAAQLPPPPLPPPTPPIPQPTTPQPPAAAPGFGEGPARETLETLPSPAELKRANRAYERGRALYQQRRYGAAIEVFLQAYERAPLPGLLYNAALAAYKLRRRKAARDLLRRYFLRPPRAEVQADEVRRARELLDELEQTLPGILSITTVPAGALVFIDSETASVGLTPFRGRLSAGPHKIRLERIRFAAARREVTVVAGEEIRLEVELRTSDASDTQSAGTGARSGLRPWVWGGVAVGAATLAAGIAMAALTQQTAHQLEQAKGEFAGANSALQARGETYSQAAIGLLVVSGATLAGAAALLIYERFARSRGESSAASSPRIRVEASPWVSPGRYGAGALLRF
jgi:tetratricopeptide (TPR) repeat protein